MGIWDMGWVGREPRFGSIQGLAGTSGTKWQELFVIPPNSALHTLLIFTHLIN